MSQQVNNDLEFETWREQGIGMQHLSSFVHPLLPHPHTVNTLY